MNIHEGLTQDVAMYQHRVDFMKEHNVAQYPIPTRETLPSGLLEVADQIANLTYLWNPVELYTPDNTKEEKDKFLEAFEAGRVYLPEFHYEYAQNVSWEGSRKKLEEFLSEVKSYKSHDRIGYLARRALLYKIQDDLATTNLIEGLQQGSDAMIAGALQRKYPGTDPLVILAAQREFEARLIKSDQQKQTQGELTEEDIRRLRAKKCGAEEIEKATTWILERNNILYPQQPNGYRVVRDDQATSIDARDKSRYGKAIVIPADREMDALKLLMNQSHEADGHAMSGMRGETLFLLGGGRLKIDDETFYEGLGLRYEDYASMKLLGYIERSPNPMYYVYAIQAAEQGNSFYDIFKQQLTMHLQIALHRLDVTNYTDIDEAVLSEAMDNAWSVTERVTRGHIDMSNTYRYATPKDLSYMRGRMIDEQLQQLGVGYLNDAAIISHGGLPLMAEIAISPDDLPYPYKEAAIDYWKEVLKPQMYGA